MNLIHIVSVGVLLLAVSSARESFSTYNKLRPPYQWMAKTQLEETPTVEEITLEKLEKMPMEDAAKMMEKIYHMSQINYELKPNFVPSPSNIPCYIYMPNGKKLTTTLDKLASTCKEQPHFGHEEVTIYITGFPETTETIKEANRDLVEAYLQRYNTKRQLPLRYHYSDEKMLHTSSEEYSKDSKDLEPSYGNLVVIDLGSTLTDFKRMALLDTEKTGEMLASVFVELIEKSDMPDETIHVVAQGIAAHVAGAVGNEFTRRTGRRLRRITALDPSKLYAKYPYTLTGLARGDAEFVDAIHTNVYGMGTIQPVGDVDFYPNGPSISPPGAENIVEASMRATRYFAESVRPGNERNFPAVAANSLKEYKNNDGYGKRIYMGIYTDYDVEGNYILEVNDIKPYGKRAPAQKQNSYHGVHRDWKNIRKYD